MRYVLPVVRDEANVYSSDPGGGGCVFSPRKRQGPSGERRRVSFANPGQGYQTAFRLIQEPRPLQGRGEMGAMHHTDCRNVAGSKRAPKSSVLNAVVPIDAGGC